MSAATATTARSEGPQRDLAAALLRRIRDARDRLERGERVPASAWERILDADRRLHGGPPTGYDR